jgi:hypothetical protein
MSTIKSSTTLTTAYSVEADTTGALVIQTGATPTTAVTIGSDQSVTFAGAVSLSGNQTTTGNLTVNGNTTLGDANTDTILMTAAPSIGGAGLGMGMGFRNRIINGGMVIDQRNAGTSVIPTTDAIYTLDRWNVRNTGGAGRFSVVQSSTSAANFPTSVLLTVTTTATPGASEFYGFAQSVEGYNMADFGWGTANAQSVAVSFQVRSSLTGTYCLSLRNSTGARAFVSEFTINTANTFETKTITIQGDTSGTWQTTTSAGILFMICLGSGSTREGTAGSWQAVSIVGTSNQVDWINTSGATFYLTGVQLEKGSTATSFDYRPYGTELALCQRYFEKSYVSATAPATATEVGVAYSIVGNSSGNPASNVYFKVSKRITPTELSIYSPVTGTIAKVRNSTAGTDENSTAYGTSENGFAALGSTSTSTTCFRFQWTAGSEI